MGRLNSQQISPKANMFLLRRMDLLSNPESFRLSLVSSDKATGISCMVSDKSSSSNGLSVVNPAFSGRMQ